MCILWSRNRHEIRSQIHHVVHHYHPRGICLQLSCAVDNPHAGGISNGNDCANGNGRAYRNRHS